MSDVTYSNTPIFDQLACERNYSRLISGGPMQLRPVAPVYVQPIIPVPVEQTDEWRDVDTTQGDAVNAADDQDVAMAPHFWKMNEEE